MFEKVCCAGFFGCATFNGSVGFGKFLRHRDILWDFINLESVANIGLLDKTVGGGIPPGINFDDDHDDNDGIF